MELDRFLAYLEYRYCEETQICGSFLSYRNKQDSQGAATISTRVDPIERLAVYEACLGLRIPVPDHLTEFAEQMNRIR